MDTSEKKQPLGKVLVIGGCGFLGSHIIDTLSSCDASISILDFRSAQQVNTRPDIVYYNADITSIDSILPVFEQGKFDVVIHTVSPLFLDGTDADFQRVNVGGTKNIIEASRKTGVKALVYTSSAIIVQNTFYMPIDNADESWPIFTGDDQEDDYARSKAQAEVLVLGANRQDSLLTCAIRPSGIFGERDSTVLPVMVETYERGQHHFQIGDNTALRDWIYAGDLAQAHVSAARALLSAHNSPDLIPENKKVDGEAFFVTGADPVPFWDFAHAVFRGLGDTSDGSVIQISMAMGIVLAKIFQAVCGFFGTKSSLTVKNVYACCQVSTFNNSKARERLGFKVAMPLEAAIERSTKWFVKAREARLEGEGF